MSLRQAVAAAYDEVGRAGLVTGAAGNVSACDRGAGTVAVTPAAGRPGLRADDVSVVSLLDGAVRDGPAPTSELATHLALLRAGAGAVIHTHAPSCVALGLVADRLPPLLAWQQLECGGEVPVIPYVAGASAAMAEAVARIASSGRVRAVIIRSHGPFTWGLDLERALSATFALEEAARAWLAVRATGAEPMRFPSSDL